MDCVNVSYGITLNGREKKILRNVNFSVKSGEMCCLMGASGAGNKFYLDHNMFKLVVRKVNSS